MNRIKGAICFFTVTHISGKKYTHDICYCFHYPNRKYLSWFPPTGAQEAPPPACNATQRPPTKAVQAFCLFFYLSQPRIAFHASVNPLQRYFPQDLQPGIGLLNSTINKNCTVELHSCSCVLPFNSQFRKWSCSLDDVFLCQCIALCNFFPSPTSKWLWWKQADGSAPGARRHTPWHQLPGSYRQLGQRFPVFLMGRSKQQHCALTPLLFITHMKPDGETGAGNHTSG